MSVKIPFSLANSLFYRYFIPGALIFFTLESIGILAWLGHNLRKIGFFSEINLSAMSALEILGIYIIWMLFFGILLSFFDYYIYTFFEGRFYWIGPLKKFSERFKENLEEDLESLERRIKNLDKESRDYREALAKILRFPLIKGKYTVVYPTTFGNLLARSEEYPWEKYGIDVVFFWHRIFYIIPKDERRVVESTKAQLDTVVYSAGYLLIFSIIYLIWTILNPHESYFFKYFGKNIPVFSSLVVFALIVLVSYSLYRLSLTQLQEYLGQFEAVFDVYRSNLLEKIGIPDVVKEDKFNSLDERDKWGVIYMYLRRGEKLKDKKFKDLYK